MQQENQLPCKLTNKPTFKDNAVRASIYAVLTACQLKLAIRRGLQL
jgi:hypothetical protein